MRRLPAEAGASGAMVKVLVVVSVAVAATLAGHVPRAAAATLEPTTTADVVDPADGLLSLREAVRQADEAPGADTIDLVAGATYTLDEPCGEIQDGDGANLLDDLDHLGPDDLMVTGDGSTIRQSIADPGCWQARVLDMGAGTLTVVGVTITGGHVDDPCFGYSFIGTGPLLCMNALGPHRGQGGGIGAEGPVVLDHATVEGNAAGDTPGGGVWSASSVTAVDATIEGNDAFWGGGLASSGPITVDRSTVAANRAVGLPYVFAPFLFPAAGGGLWSDEAVTLRNSTVTGNRVPGRIAVPPGSGRLQRVRGSGGGVWAGGHLDLTHVTVADNRADRGANLFVEDEGLGSFGSAIGLGKPGARSCAVGGGATSAGYNVVAVGRCRLGAGPGDLVGQAPFALGPLAANGGPTRTRLPGDEALSTIPPSACTVAPADQRGVTRPDGPSCEAGSVEVP